MPNSAAAARSVLRLTKWNLVSATVRYVFCGGALYWTSSKGFWGGFCDSEGLYCKTKVYATTKIKRVEWKYGVKLLRDEEQIKRDLTYNSKYYWNTGVRKTFYFFSNIRTILNDSYTNLRSGKFFSRDEEEEDGELEAEDYDDDEEEEDEPVETKKKETAKKDEVVDKTSDETTTDASKVDASKVDASKVDASKVDTSDSHLEVDIKAEADKLKAEADKLKAEAALLFSDADALAEKEKEIEEKLRSDPSGMKAKIIKKIKEIHGM